MHHKHTGHTNVDYCLCWEVSDDSLHKLAGDKLAVVMPISGFAVHVSENRGLYAPPLQRLAIMLPAQCRLPSDSSPLVQGVLSPPQPLGSSLLLPRPWALLLRILLQQGVPEHLLQQLTQPSLGDESALESAVWSLFPEECQKAWHAAPHRMGTAEAQVSCGCTV